MCQTLIGAGADVNARDDSGATPWFYAFGGRTTDGPAAARVDLLADAGAQINPPSQSLPPISEPRDSTTVLHLAVKDRKTAATRRLLAGGADAGEIDAHGRTPYRLAIESGRTDLRVLPVAEQTPRRGPSTRPKSRPADDPPS